MEVIVTPMGSRGWMPRAGRQTMCTLVRMGKVNFLLDCGTGASRLLEPSVQALLGDGPLTVLFSHYHLDHMVGLMYLPGIFGGSGRPLRLAGPRAGFTQHGLLEACARLTTQPLSSRHYLDFPCPLELCEFGPDGLILDGIHVAASLQDHPGGSVALRIGEALCYATDLAASTRELALAEGVKALIHEAWSLEPQAPLGPHSGLPEALERARRAGVPRLIPSHFGPAMTEAEIRRMGAFSADSVQVLVPMEGRPIRIGQAWGA